MTDTDTNQPQGEPERISVLNPEWEDGLRRGQEQEGERGSVEPELAMVHLLRHAREPESLSTSELDSIWTEIDAELNPQGAVWWRRAWIWWATPALAAAAVFAFVVLPQSSEESAVAYERAPAVEEDSRDAKMDAAAKDSAPGAAAAEGYAPNRGPGAAPPAPSPRESKAVAENMAAEDMPEPEAEEELAEASGMGGAAGLIAQAGGGRGARGRSPQAQAMESNYFQLAPQGRAALAVAVDSSRDTLREQLLAKSRGGGR